MGIALVVIRFSATWLITVYSKNLAIQLNVVQNMWWITVNGIIYGRFLAQFIN